MASGSSSVDARAVADRLDALAAQLSDSAKSIREGSISFDTDIEERSKIIKAAKEVIDVGKQQKEQFVDLYMVLVPLTVIRIFIKWKVFENIPESDTISYGTLAAKVGADRSLIGMALVQRFFLAEYQLTSWSPSRSSPGMEPRRCWYSRASWARSGSAHVQIQGLHDEQPYERHDLLRV